MRILKTALVAALAAAATAVVVAQASTSPAARSSLTTHVVTHHVSSPGTVGTRSGSVSCPSGSRVTGGGYIASYGGSQTVVDDKPSGNGWHVKILQTGAITVYAVCAS
jgi:hypothetical protein